MVTTSVEPSRADGHPEEDWPTATTDAIVKAIDTVRSKTAEPLERVVRVVVYGLLAAIVGTAALVLVAIALVRGIIVVIDLITTREVWAAHLITGGIFTLTGLFLWRKRTTKTVKV